MEKHIMWVDDKEKRLEKKVLSEYSEPEIRKHLNYLTTLTRIAGSEDERKAANYIKKKLEEYGLEAEIHEFDGYISQPNEASLEIVSPVQKSLPCLPLAFIASTPPEGIEAQLCHVGEGNEKGYQGVDSPGKIILIGPVGKEDHAGVATLAERKGAVAQIHINKGSPRAIDMSQLRRPWGAPTPETMNDIPQTASVSICNEDGLFLIDLLRKGPVVARLKADSWRGYHKVCFPMGTLKGGKERDDFVLLASHYCSWFKGATDNAAANSLLLEMARIFSKHRRSLNRSIKFAWWTGHSQGTFAGSSWYVDNYWSLIRDHGIAYLVMDGLGRKGAAGFEAKDNEEIRKFYEAVIKETLGIEVKSRRLTRSGDQSAWGLGLPSGAASTSFTEEQVEAMGGKPVWYSHTIEDTLDKLDMELVKLPFKVNAVSTLRMCNNPILPFEFVTVAESFKKRIQELQKGDKSGIDLGTLVKRAEELVEKAGALNQMAEKALASYEKKGADGRLEQRFGKINNAMKDLSRLLLPALTSKIGKYGQDPLQGKSAPVPAFEPLETLNSMNPESDEYRALRTSLLRRRNMLSDVLNDANSILDRVLGTK